MFVLLLLLIQWGAILRNLKKRRKHDLFLSIYCLSSFLVKVVDLATLVEGDPKAPFSIATTLRYRGERYSFSGIAPLYPYLIMVNAKQGSTKYHFLSLWYDSTWD